MVSGSTYKTIQLMVHSRHQFARRMQSLVSLETTLLIQMEDTDLEFSIHLHLEKGPVMLGPMIIQIQPHQALLSQATLQFQLFLKTLRAGRM
jgi:hypothetical protein